mmetsp:Transcript_23488/g.93110  ORF Transcript_23488/g.93110 Transcript_23488/m.93110 type:complete len:81 (-) Transcript_23488:256-498(-)
MLRRAAPPPAFIGALLGLAGIGYLVDSLGLLLFPIAYTGSATPVLMTPAFVAEVALCGWLLWDGACRGECAPRRGAALGR